MTQHEIEIQEAQDKINLAQRLVEQREEILDITKTAMQHIQKLITEGPLIEAQ